jgi:orotidine-5'-phosphate decarboxylase
VKPQSAFFEARGWQGVRSFEAVCAYARDAGLLVIADVKRGDIGSTAAAYAAAFAPHADAATVNPYLGGDAVEPFLDACRRGAGIFVLVKTSNPGSGDLQDVRLEDGRRVWERVAELVDRWGSDLVGERGLSSVGAVVGATYPQEVAEARALLPRAPFLLPGVGAQGATAADVAAAFANGPAGGLVSASRSVIFADDPGAEAERLAREIWDVSQAA